MKTSLRLALAILAAALSPLAAARTSLVASFPAPGAVLTGSPTEIHLTFDAHVEARYCRVKLVSSAGKHFDADRPQTDKADANAIVAAVPVLKAGTYTARWTAAGADGHRTHGDFTFTVK